MNHPRYTSSTPPTSYGSAAYNFPGITGTGILTNTPSTPQKTDKPKNYIQLYNDPIKQPVYYLIHRNCEWYLSNTDLKTIEVINCKDMRIEPPTFDSISNCSNLRVLKFCQLETYYLLGYPQTEGEKEVHNDRLPASLEELHLGWHFGMFKLTKPFGNNFKKLTVTAHLHLFCIDPSDPQFRLNYDSNPYSKDLLLNYAKTGTLPTKFPGLEHIKHWINLMPNNKNPKRIKLILDTRCFDDEKFVKLQSAITKLNNEVLSPLGQQKNITITLVSEQNTYK